MLLDREDPLPSSTIMRHALRASMGAWSPLQSAAASPRPCLMGQCTDDPLTAWAGSLVIDARVDDAHGHGRSLVLGPRGDGPGVLGAHA